MSMLEYFFSNKYAGQGELFDGLTIWKDEKYRNIQGTYPVISVSYNPWSIINFLDTGKITTYWANTSGNSLVGKLIREGSRGIKEQFEILLQGNEIETKLDEQIVYNQLEQKESAIWSLLIAGGYLKVVEANITDEAYKLRLTNYEVMRMFQNMISDWFETSDRRKELCAAVKESRICDRAY